MKLSVVSFLTALLAVVSAQVTSPTGVFNVTSPVNGKTYVIGQFIPCIWDVLPNIDTSGITLNINLVSTGAGSNQTLSIAQNADVSSKTNPQQQGNSTYYEYKVNYQIPPTVAGGSYNVVFDANGAALTIPITIQASMTTSSAGPSSTGASSSSSGSIFNAAPRPGLDLTTKTLGALTIVACIAFAL
ncbi:hypothetical protein DM01DRAFT_1382004 [Hesseltinella vesiculosa]|uniref:Uncharacterized protein n=1 Tax=Hesseltinella vesiculosa TaxID=101127 RepID=A0A1X2GP50_9FUNG|nr:hypothetical protein DM01DRAFT_1382004 [Hesseltinella vesiculosa]